MVNVRFISEFDVDRSLPKYLTHEREQARVVGKRVWVTGAEDDDDGDGPNILDSSQRSHLVDVIECFPKWHADHGDVNVSQQLLRRKIVHDLVAGIIETQICSVDQGG